MHYEWFLRVFIAAVCGALIGRERKVQHKDAGLRTHSILAIGSALLMILSKYGFSDVGRFDAARIAAQVVTGVGFLGAGVIFERKGSISGLTTAAGLWLTSGVGLCIGAGLYDIGIFTTILLVCIQFGSHTEVYHRLTDYDEDDNDEDE